MSVNSQRADGRKGKQAFWPKRHVLGGVALKGALEGELYVFRVSKQQISKETSTKLLIMPLVTV